MPTHGASLCGHPVYKRGDPDFRLFLEYIGGDESSSVLFLFLSRKDVPPVHECGFSEEGKATPQ